MANLYRRIGVNVYVYMEKARLTPEDFAKKMSYLPKDVWNVIEGKVMIPPVEIEKISSVLGINKEKLIDSEPECLVPNLEFMKEFSDLDNLDKILDLMDEYVEIKEAL